jgi:hypothetical protein
VSDPNELLDQIREILAEPITDVERVTRIAALLYPPAEPRPIERDERNWPILPSGSGVVELPDQPYDPRD